MLPENAASVEDADDVPVVRALRSYKAGELSEEELYRAILAHDTWHVPVTEAHHALLWEIDGTQYMVALHDETGPYAEGRTLPPMGARHLVNNLPAEATGVAFDLGQPHALGLETSDGEGMLDALREQADARDVEVLLEDRSEGDAALLLDHEWLFLAREGAPSAEAYGGLHTICLFSAGPALRHFLAVQPELTELNARRASGYDLFAHLAERDDFDAVWINPGRRPVWAPFGPALCDDLLAGRDPRPEARILPARTVAEIHFFLDLEGMMQDHRRHQLEYAGDELVARYVGPMLVGGSGSYRFFPVEPTDDPRSFGPGPTEIICAGKLADLVRRRMAMLPESFDWTPGERLDFLLLTARWAVEVEKVLEPGEETLPRRSLRSPDGARFVREFPEIATRDWLSRARRTVETLAASIQ